MVVIALGFSVAAIISVYTGVEESTENAQEMIEGYEEYLVETGELSDFQERMIQVSTSRFGVGRPFGGQSQASNISADAIEIISQIDYVEEVIPLIESPVGEVDFETMRAEMQKLRESGDFNPGEGGFQEMQDLRMSFYDYIIMGVPTNSTLDDTHLIFPENIVDGRKINENDQSMVLLREDLTFSDDEKSRD